MLSGRRLFYFSMIYFPIITFDELIFILRRTKKMDRFTDYKYY